MTQKKLGTFVLVINGPHTGLQGKFQGTRAEDGYLMVEATSARDEGRVAFVKPEWVRFP